MHNRPEALARAVELAGLAVADIDFQSHLNPGDHYANATLKVQLGILHALIAIATPAGDPHVCGQRRDNGENPTFPCVLLPDHPGQHSDRDGDDW